MNTLRFLAVQASTCTLGIVLVLVVVLQGRELAGAGDLFPAASFVVFLTLSSMAIGWARLNPPIAAEADQRRSKRAGLDLFIAAILTLVSEALLRIAQSPLLKTSPWRLPSLWLHVIFLAAGLTLGWFALGALLRLAVDDPPPPSRRGSAGS